MFDEDTKKRRVVFVEGQNVVQFLLKVKSIWIKG